ncbi:MAG: apolipoprotein N-acyltransferase [Lutimaribacter sp.]
MASARPATWRKRAGGLAALAGAGAALGHAPLGLWPVSLVALAALFALFRGASTWRAAMALGWAAGVGYFALALAWIVEPFFVDIARHGWMAPFALLGMAGGLALFWGAAHGMAWRLGGGAVPWAVALALAELARSYVLTGFPWALIGHVLIEAPFLPVAGFVGAQGLTLLALALAVGVYALLRRQSVVAVLIFGCAVGLGAYAHITQSAQIAARPAETARPVLRLIQPNAAQHLKWDPAMTGLFFRRQLRLTAAPDPAGRPDLVIWPETAIPVSLNYAQPVIAQVAQAAQGAPVVMGMLREEGVRLYNSAVLIDGQGVVSAIYDKHHLVPFGEYMPLSGVMARLGIAGFVTRGGQGFSAGPGARLMSVAGVGQALPLICYEAVFPQDVAAAPARPEFLLQITNDAWFGKISGPYQHLAQARLRAVEQGLPMVRAANTGISAMIDIDGTVTASLGLGQAGFVQAALPAARPPTVYARLGDWPIALLYLVVLVLCHSESNKTRARIRGL